MAQPALADTPWAEALLLASASLSEERRRAAADAVGRRRKDELLLRLSRQNQELLQRASQAVSDPRPEARTAASDPPDSSEWLRFVSQLEASNAVLMDKDAELLKQLSRLDRTVRNLTSENEFLRRGYYESLERMGPLESENESLRAAVSSLGARSSGQSELLSLVRSTLDDAPTPAAVSNSALLPQLLQAREAVAALEDELARWRDALSPLLSGSAPSGPLEARACVAGLLSSLLLLRREAAAPGPVPPSPISPSSPLLPPPPSSPVSLAGALSRERLLEMENAQLARLLEQRGQLLRAREEDVRELSEALQSSQEARVRTNDDTHSEETLASMASPPSSSPASRARSHRSSRARPDLEWRQLRRLRGENESLVRELEESVRFGDEVQRTNEILVSDVRQLRVQLGQLRSLVVTLHSEEGDGARLSPEALLSLVRENAALRVQSEDLRVNLLEAQRSRALEEASLVE